MSTEKISSVSEKMRNQPLIQEALREAVQDAVREHKLLGQPIVIWRDGQVVWVPPEEIVLDEKPEGKNGTPTA